MQFKKIWFLWAIPVLALLVWVGSGKAQSVYMGIDGIYTSNFKALGNAIFNQNVTIAGNANFEGQTVANQNVTVVGNANVEGGVIISTPGTVTNPALLVNSSGTGLWSPGSLTLGFDANGIAAGQINGTAQWSGVKRVNATKTAAYSVLTTDALTVFNNTAAGSQVVYSLPACTGGGEQFTFVNTAAGTTYTKILANGTDKIAQNGTLGSAGGNLVSSAVWTSVDVVCFTTGVWIVRYVVGTWTLT